MALFAPLLTPYDPAVIDLSAQGTRALDHASHGTDNLGRDVFSRVVHGTRISLRVGVIAMVISIVIGTFLGGAAGFFGGTLDSVVMRLTDVFLALPAAILALAVMAVFENPSVNKIFIVLGLIGWTTVARLVRSRVLEIRNEEYILAAAALGFSRMRTLLWHVLPNAAAPIIVAATIGIAGNILTEAWLSFLGLGAPPHVPSWGRMIIEGQSYLVTASKPWMYVFPGTALFFTSSASTLGEASGCADPTLKNDFLAKTAKAQRKNSFTFCAFTFVPLCFLSSRSCSVREDRSGVNMLNIKYTGRVQYNEEGYSTGTSRHNDVVTFQHYGSEIEQAFRDSSTISRFCGNANGPTKPFSASSCSAAHRTASSIVLKAAQSEKASTTVVILNLREH